MEMRSYEYRALAMTTKNFDIPLLYIRSKTMVYAV